MFYRTLEHCQHIVSAQSHLTVNKTSTALVGTSRLVEGRIFLTSGFHGQKTQLLKKLFNSAMSALRYNSSNLITEAIPQTKCQ